MPRINKTRAILLCGILAGATLVVLYAQQSADIIPLRQVSDPYPVFNGIAIDPENNLVEMSDVNRKSLLSYARSVDSKRGEITAPRSQVFGPLTNVGFVAGESRRFQRERKIALYTQIEK